MTTEKIKDKDTEAETFSAIISGLGVTAAAVADLAEPTPADEIKTRPAFKGGPMLAYVDARFVQNRLDGTLGPINWQTRFEDTGSGGIGVRCGIGINVMGEWVWKWDVGIPSNIEATKGAHSDAFKRAAVQWGVARDLYEDREGDHAPEVPIRQAVKAAPAAPANDRAARYAPRTDEDERMQAQAEDDTDWVCPVHGEVKVVPAGISKKGNKYAAFKACPEYGCDETER